MTANVELTSAKMLYRYMMRISTNEVMFPTKIAREFFADNVRKEFKASQNISESSLEYERRLGVCIL